MRASTAPSQAASGTGLELKSLTKRFGEDVLACDGINLHIAHGEYVVLLGPSGCGKTTTLRMIGGHEEPTSGDIVLDGQSLLGLPPDKRPTTTVFQHFALFPTAPSARTSSSGRRCAASPRPSGARRR